MNIGIDIMGGDFAPDQALSGIADYLKANDKPGTLFLIGDESQVPALLDTYQIPSTHLRIIHAPQVIEMDESPTKALREKQQSSIAIGFHLLATGKIDAFISAGNTGAMMVGALYSIKPIDGVTRPTIGAYVPRENGTLGLLLDAGINSDCKPENLLQFGILGSLFARHVWNIEAPKVGLINIGEEEGKGNLLTQAAYPLLKENERINFVGNIEGRDLFLDKTDVMVCEGFTGNVILKLAESIYDIVQRRNIQDEYFGRFNFETYGGVPVLGVNKPVIIGHGISRSEAFVNMIRMAERIIESNLIDKIREAFQTHPPI